MILLLVLTVWLLVAVLVLSLCAAASRGERQVYMPPRRAVPGRDPVPAPAAGPAEPRFFRDGMRETPSRAQARR